MTGDPVAADAAQVRAGNARFTVLTARLLRMEWSSDGDFEDRGTYAFPQRRAEPPPFEVREEDGATVVDTGSLVLRHTPDGRPFHAGNLSVERAEPPAFRWVPGAVDRHNLGGARRTVDRVRGGAALDPGLVSRSGWALFDDSAGVVFAREDGWVEPRPERPDYQDWYLFGHGHDYAGAVGDYTRFGGAIPLVPRFVLGAWWSRYWPYSDAEIRALVDDFRAHGLPLDVFVIDMDWHTTDSWTGYSWNRELFPDPRGFLAWLHARGCTRRSTCIPRSASRRSRTPTRRSRRRWAPTPRRARRCRSGSATATSSATTSSCSTIRSRRRASTSGGSTGSRARRRRSAGSTRCRGSTTCTSPTWRGARASGR